MAPQKGGQANKQPPPPPPPPPAHARQPSAAMAVPPAAASAAGNAAAPAKKPAAAAAPAHRPAVVPAIPLPLLRRQSSKHHQQRPRHHPRNASSALASPTSATPPSNRLPAPSLEAALIDIQSGAGEPALALPKAAHAQAHAQDNLQTSGNGVPVDVADAVGIRAANNTANGAASANEKVNGNGNRANKTNGFRKHPHDRRQPAVNGANGTNGVHGHGATNGIASITFGDVAPDLSSTTGRTTPDTSANISMAPSATGDGDSHNAGLPPNHHPGPDSSENELPSSSSAPPSQPQSATHPPADFMSNGHHPYFAHAPGNTSNGHGPGFPNGMTAPPHMHGLQHPVNGNGNGVVFGGMGFDSHSSSPAPLSAGFMPPPGPFPRPGFPPAGDHSAHMRAVSHGHAHTDSNGPQFPLPPTSYGPEMNARSSAMDGQAPIPAPPPGHLPGHPPPLGPYGANFGAPQSAWERHIRWPSNRTGVLLDPTLDDALAHTATRWLLSQFNSPMFSDCTLEIVFGPSQSSDKYHAHRMVLARSPTLKESVMHLVQQQDANTICYMTDERYVHPDAWRCAVQHLYQAPLPHFGTLELVPGTQATRFNWCLSLAAAGHGLQLPAIFARGIQLAQGLLGWDTLEEGLSFVLESASHQYRRIAPNWAIGAPYIDFHYGDETAHLMSAILYFLVNHFPADFVLDTSVADPPQYARLPVHLTPVKTAPAIAHGSSGIQRSPEHGRNLSQLAKRVQFGDVPPAFPEEDNTARKPAPCSPQLSRVLLNLPFPMLKQVLTSESSGVSGWNTAQDRYHALSEVVAQREFRRLHAIEYLRTSTMPEIGAIKARLSLYDPPEQMTAWDELNWREEVLPPTGAGVPVLGRTWEPQFAEPQAAELQVAEPQITEPQVAEPQMAEPQVAEPQVVESQVAEPQMSEPQIMDPPAESSAPTTG